MLNLGITLIVLFFKYVLSTPIALASGPVLLNICFRRTTVKSFSFLLLLCQTKQEIIMTLQTDLAILIIDRTVGGQIRNIHTDIGFQNQHHFLFVFTRNTFPVLTPDASVLAFEILV
jgi:hypothetical protein